MNRHSFKEDIPIATKHMKSCSTSIMVRDMETQTTMNDRFTPIEMATIRKKKITNVGKDTEKWGPLCVAGGDMKWHNYCEKQFDGFSKSET